MAIHPASAGARSNIAPRCSKELWIPPWSFAAPVGLLGILARLRTRRPSDPGLCPSCGYVLAGLAKDAKCPECGKAKNG